MKYIAYDEVVLLKSGKRFVFLFFLLIEKYKFKLWIYSTLMLTEHFKIAHQCNLFIIK